MLIKNITEFTNNCEANYSIKFESIRMSIYAAEKRHIIPIIGQELYDSLNTAHANGADTTEESNLIAAIQKPLASLALAMYIPIGDISIGDAGARRRGTTDMPGAYKYQVQNAIEALYARGYDFLEDLIVFLESNIDDYPSWVTSNEFIEYRKLLIRTGAEFAAVYTGARHPRQTFMKLRGALLHVQENVIRPTILDDIYEDLLEKLAANPIGYTSEDKELVQFLQRAMAYLALKEGISDYSLSIDSNGVTILNEQNDSSANDVSKRMAASDTQLASLVKNANNIGFSWLKRATEYLDATASDSAYEAWFEKLEEEAATKTTNINESLGGSFML